MPQATEHSIAATTANSGRRSRISDTLLVAFLTLAAAVLRLLHLGAKSLWYDEPLTVALARISWPSFTRLWSNGEAAYQGAYFLFMRGWIRLGDNEAWLRLPSALFAIASVPLIYVVARKLVGEKAALASAAMLAFSSTSVYYSQEARGYTLTIFLVLLSAWAWVRAVQDGRESDWLLWTLFSALAIYSHLFASLAVIAQACSLFALHGARPWRRMMLHGLMIVALTAPGFAFLLNGRPVHDPSLPEWPRATPKQLLHLVTFLGGSGEKAVLSAILWVAAFVAIWRERLNRVEGEEFWRGIFLICWAILPVVLLAIISVAEPLFVQRYLILCLPATVMLAARGMIALPRHNIGVWLVVALCVASVVNIFMGYRKPREDWRRATAAVLASAGPGDALVIYPFFARTGFDYYYDRQRDVPQLQTFPRFYDRGEDEQTLQRALSQNPHAFSHVWVMMREQGPGKNNLRDYSPDLSAKLQSIFGEPRVTKYQGLTVLEFGG